MRCALHSCALGFHICNQGESIYDPVSVLYQRFTESCENAIGDFNCMCLVGAMKRDANFFGKTVFFSDTMHHNTHTHCSECFNGNHYKTIYNKPLMRLNDSAVEQRNRIINKIKISLMYSNLNTFMIMVKFILEMDNRQLLRRLHGLKSVYKS